MVWKKVENGKCPIKKGWQWCYMPDKLLFYLFLYKPWAYKTISYKVYQDGLKKYCFRSSWIIVWNISIISFFHVWCSSFGTRTLQIFIFLQFMFSALVLTAIWPCLKATVHETEHSPSYAKPKKFATKYHVEEIN